MENVYFTENVFVTMCNQLSLGARNPAHFMLGHGRLFVHSFFHNLSYPYSMVLYHQCSPSTGWSWAEKMEDIIWEDAVHNGAVPDNEVKLRWGDAINISNGAIPDKTRARLFLPFVANDDLGNHYRSGAIICGKTVYQEVSTGGLYFGQNYQEDITRWRETLRQKGLTKKEKNLKEQPLTKTSIPDSRTNYDEKCAQELRFAMWKRFEGSSLRRFINADEVEQLLLEKFRSPLSILSVNSSTSFEDQVSIFQSFDVLITCHGSHLTNMIFTPPDTALIELQAVPYDFGPFYNGKSFVQKWILSFGHKPYNRSDLVKVMESCSDHNATICPWDTRSHFIQSDLRGR